MESALSDLLQLGHFLNIDMTDHIQFKTSALERFVDGVIERLKSKGLSSSEISKHRKRLYAEYSDILLPDNTETDLLEISVSSFPYHLLTLENRVSRWREHYEAQKGTPCEVFSDEEEIQTESFGSTVLHKAVLDNNVFLVHKLLRSGIDPAKRDNSGLTAYQYAILHQRNTIAKLLSQYED